LSLDDTTYGDPLVSNGTLTAGSDEVCLSFDLFRRRDIVSPNTPEGGVIVATTDPNQPSAVDNIVVTGSNVTITGTTYVFTKEVTGISTTQDIIDTKQNTGRGMIVEYTVERTDSAGFRTGSMMVVWNDSSTVSFTDVSTKDVDSSTAGLSLKVTSDGTDVTLGAGVTSGTYTVNVHIRVIGVYR